MDSTDAVQRLERDLRKICGPRLRSLLTYGAHAPTPAHGNGHHSDDEHATAIRSMVVVDSLSLVDLRACAALTPAWHDSGLATPLIVTTHELERSLDVFPLEFDSIRSRHSLVAGSDPFASLGVDVADIRRACEVQARSHLLHLREGCLETGGRADALSLLIVESAPAFAGLITTLARLEKAPHHTGLEAARYAERILALSPGAIADIVALVGVHEITSAQATQLFPAYLHAAETLVAYVDKWRA